jgi:hypothetical protein
MCFDKDRILEHLDMLNQAIKDKYPDSKIHIILIGASSLLIKHSLQRATHDIDITDSGIPRLIGIGGMLQKLGFHVVSEVLVNFHPDYVDRLEMVSDKENISILSIHPYDIAITKIGRGLQKDFDDLFESNILSKIDIPRLDDLYQEASSYWIGDPENFSRNWERFINHVHQRRPDLPTQEGNPKP